MTKKETNQVSGKIVNSFFDRGDGVVEFPNGLVITDDSVMWSGTKYDIESLDIDEYPGQLTLDHFDSISEDALIGKVEGVRKQGNKITVDRIRYAINASENARRAYNLLVEGFSNAFSIETVGPWADEETNTMHNHKLIGLSQVVIGNNKHAVANSIKKFNTADTSEENEDTEQCIARHEIRVENDVEAQVNEGEDVAKVEEHAETEAIETEEQLVDIPEKEENDIVDESEKQEDSEKVEESKAEESTDVEDEAKDEAAESEDDAEPSDTTHDDGEEVVEESEEESDEKVENSAETEDESKEESDEDDSKNDSDDKSEEDKEEDESETEEAPADEEVSESDEAVADDTDEASEEQPADEKVENNIKTNNENEEKMTKEEVSKLINEAFKNFAEAQAASDIDEPEVTEADKEEVDNSYSLEKHANLVLRALKTKSALDYQKLEEMNARNLDALKAEGKVDNAMTTADWGNFVLPPEMYTQIVGIRTEYSAILEATNWRETDRLEYAWLTRNGDIDMKNVAMCETHPVTSGNKNDNLKPISEYGAVQHIEQMEHLAAVTPVCTAATKYLIVDLLGDAIAGYRNNYDKKRAELVIAKLQEAVNISGQKVPFDSSATYDDKLEAFIDTLKELSDTTSAGTFVFNERTLLQVMKYVTPRESALGDRAFDAGKDGIRRLFGRPYIVVPNTLMPSLDSTAANPVISYIPVDASSTAPEDIEITSPVFYGDLDQFIGFTSGGLKFSISEDAAYETADGTVRSAYQRDEVVLRGYFYRGGAYRYPKAMAAITNEVVS